MKLMTLPATAVDTGFVGRFPDLYTRSARSTINVAAISDQIREVLADWDEIDLDAVLAEAPTGRPESYPVDEIGAVEFLRDLLRISQDRVLQAVGIAERTFFGWKQHGRRPRTSSTGLLWAAVEALYYLQESHPNLAGWFNDNIRAQELFAAGQFDKLVALELDWAVREYAPTPAQAPYDYTQERIPEAAVQDASKAPRDVSRRMRTATPTTLRALARRKDD